MHINKPPGPIIAISVVWTLATIFELYRFSQSDISQLPPWFPFFFIGMSGATLAAIAAMWQMKKWGVIFFAGLFALNQALLITMGYWGINSILMPMLVIVVGMVHLKQMR